MLTDMESTEREESYGSSQTRRRKNSDKSPQNSRNNSSRGQGAGAGESQETKLSSLDVLLSMLQSHLGEIRDFGGSVLISRKAGGGILINMPDVNICTNHRMMHNGQQCPMC